MHFFVGFSVAGADDGQVQQKATVVSGRESFAYPSGNVSCVTVMRCGR